MYKNKNIVVNNGITNPTIGTNKLGNKSSVIKNNLLKIVTFLGTRYVNYKSNLSKK
jgi:hypothetical protein